MQFRRRDSGFIIVLALCVLAIWPFLRYASLPHDTDAELHIFRLAELARMWQGGIVYPRWAANFYYGFGYPIFNFYAPLTYYIALLFNLLPGFDPVASTKVVLLLGIIGAGMGMYGFVRDQFGRTAAFVAAASYVYAPYILYIDPHARGVLPESFAFAVFPFALWSVDKLLRRPSGKRFLAAVSLLAAIILTHNLMAMVFGSLTFAYFVWLLMVGIGTGERLSGVGIRLTLLAFGLGVGVAAFFWLPMVLEQNAIQIASVIGEGSHYDFRNHFMTLGELFGGMPRFDWGASQPYFKHSLGIMQWVLGLLGFGRILFTRSLRRKQALFFAIIAISLIFLMLPQSLWLWRTIPVLPFLQFPWRLLGATNAMLAVLAGFLFADLSPTEPSTQPTQPQNPLLAATVIGLILLMALPLTQVKPWSNFGDTNAQAVLASELAGRWRGTTSTADFVPATVDVTPREQPQITRQIQQGLPIDPLNRETLGDAQVETEIISPTHFRFQVQTQQELVLRLFIFDFPGWQAKVDGVAAAIELATPDGFITVPVAAGTHVVEVWFGSTPTRQAGAIISGLSVLIALAVGGIFGRKSPHHPITPSSPPAHGLTPIVLSIATVTLLNLLILDPSGILRYDSKGSIVQPAQTDDADVAFEDKIDLIGFTVPPQIQAGQRQEIVLYWKSQRPLSENYQVFVHLLTPELSIVAQSDKLNPGEFPTKNWSSEEYVRDSHWLDIPAALPAGTYELAVGLWDSSAEKRLQPSRQSQSDSAIIKVYVTEK